MKNNTNKTQADKTKNEYFLNNLRMYEDGEIYLNGRWGGYKWTFYGMNKQKGWVAMSYDMYNRFLQHKLTNQELCEYNGIPISQNHKKLVWCEYSEFCVAL
jgi:hypothetical protein